ncbi:Pimeloyl-ACP methyl ester carboxylesterase [Dyadobacter koreensis]|uniref:Pimeloyl-ACP methyl ester carboxylesterase n=1 Tax=Dyadobacter koreensis TaxID=408657 RepID=A0A1H6S3P6_9BACT|nr:alpha/beta fold hydrolase [Dyadobacter koreensis]SEI58650.1 Pimeloyl-ACP methyl ester carboxylesterase [Dyadobacter koreensis]
MKTIIAFFTILFSVTLISCNSNSSPTPVANTETVVLVHGAWQGAYAWATVKSNLEKKGYKVIAVELPAHGDDQTSVAGITLSSYSAKVISVIEAQPSKVILVGHSMGGMVISEVSEKIPSKIVKLVYLAAFLPKSQQSLLEISSADKQTLLPAALEFSADQTTVSVKKDNLVAIFCQDGSETIKQILLDKNRTEPLLPLTQKVTLTDANFGSVPKFYIRTVNDKAIGITLQDQMITTTPVKKVYSLNAGHTAHLSHANEVSKIIEEISATK